MNDFKSYLEGERGRGSKLAADLEVSPSAISQWAETQIPAERVFKVAKLIGIPAEKLRPDIFGASR